MSTNLVILPFLCALVLSCGSSPTDHLDGLGASTSHAPVRPYVKFMYYPYQYRLAQDTVHLTCCLPYTHGISAADVRGVTWYHEGQPMHPTAASRVNLSTSEGCAPQLPDIHHGVAAGRQTVLTISALTLGDSGKYTCAFNTSSGVYQNSSEVSVKSYCTGQPYFRSDVEAPRSSYVVNAGESLKVSCQLECGLHIFVSRTLRKRDGSLNLTNTGRPDFHKLVFDQAQQHETEVFRNTWQIERATSQHNGEWYCLGVGLGTRPVLQHFNITVKSTAAVQLRVLGRNNNEGSPVVISSSPDQQRSLVYIPPGNPSFGKQLRFRCLAEGSWQTAPKFRWLRVDGAHRASDAWKVSKRLRDGQEIATVRNRDGIQDQDLGQYACIAENSHVNVNHSVVLLRGSIPTVSELELVSDATENGMREVGSIMLRLAITGLPRTRLSVHIRVGGVVTGRVMRQLEDLEASVEHSLALQPSQGLLVFVRHRCPPVTSMQPCNVTILHDRITASTNGPTLLRYSFEVENAFGKGVFSKDVIVS